MASTQIQAFALGAGANVMSPTAYAALAAVSTGYESGIAQSIQFNTTLRQAAFMSAALANFLVAEGITQNDDGNISGAVANIQQAIKQLTGSPTTFAGGTTTGTANAQVLATVTPTGWALTNGYTIIATAGYTNTGATTFDGPDGTIQTVKKLSGSSYVALTGGEFQATVNFSLTWNSTANAYIISATPTLGALAYLNIGANLANEGSGNLITTAGVPSGAVLDFAGSSVPTYYLLCYGQAVSRTTYAALFSAIGTTYGTGDGSTTFNLPDCRGRVIAGQDNMGGTAANRITNAVSAITGTTLGAAGGDQNVQLHTHGVSDPGHNHSYTFGGNGAAAGSPNYTCGAGANTTGTSTTGITIQNYGTGSSANVQPTMIMNKIIKT